MNRFAFIKLVALVKDEYVASELLDADFAARAQQRLGVPVAASAVAEARRQNDIPSNYYVSARLRAERAERAAATAAAKGADKRAQQPGHDTLLDLIAGLEKRIAALEAARDSHRIAADSGRHINGSLIDL